MRSRCCDKNWARTLQPAAEYNTNDRRVAQLVAGYCPCDILASMAQVSQARPANAKPRGFKSFQMLPSSHRWAGRWPSS